MKIANECDFGMVVTGKRKKLEEFLGVIYFFYNTDFQLFFNEKSNEVDSADLINKSQHKKTKRNIWTITPTSINKDIFTEFDEESDEDITTYEIVGHCKWSIYSSMLEGEDTYYDSSENIDDSTVSSLIKESNLLNLVIECYGDEPGLGVKEYLLIKFGNVEKYESSNFTLSDLKSCEVDWEYECYEDLFC